jgi:FAD/FMN-containing dehydrogenase
VAGPQTGPSDEVLEPGTIMVGIRLRPGVVPAVFGLPAADPVVVEAVRRLMPGRTAEVTHLPSMLSVSERHLRRLIGIGAPTPGGGLGRLGRTYGLTADRLRAAEVVLAAGRIVTCDQHRFPDLFWALRGGGATGLGVVTAFTFDPVAAPS